MTLSPLREFPVRKAVGAVFVLALHLLIVAVFISATHVRIDRTTPGREILLLFVPPKAKPEIVKPRTKASAPKALRVVPEQVYPDYNHVTLPALPDHGAALKGLPSPFDCAPRNRGGLTPSQIAQCETSVTSQPLDNAAVDYADHTNRSKNAAQWARDRARKNAPLLLPCMSPGGFNPIYTAYCLGKAAVQGKIDPESGPGYQDLPDHAVNEGDTRLAPVPH